MQAKVITISQKATTGSQAYTGVGFQPKLITIEQVVRITGQTHTASDQPNNGWMYGAATSSSERYCSWFHDDDGAATTNGAAGYTDANVIYHGNAAGTIQVAADLVSMDSDGFTLNWGTTDGNSRTYIVTCYGGSDFQAKVGYFQANTGTGDQDVTGIGFQPNALISWSTRWGNDTFPNNTAQVPRIHMGFADSAGNQHVKANYINGSGVTTSSTQNRQSTSNLILMITSTGAVDVQASFVSYLSDGFRVNWSAVDGTAHRNLYIAIRAPQSKVATFSGPDTSTGNAAVTGVGFTPKALRLMASGTVDTGADHAGFYGGTGSGPSNQGQWSGTSRDNQGTTVSNASWSAHIYEQWDLSHTSRSRRAALDSMDSDGFTLNWDTNTTGSPTIAYLALGGDDTRVPRLGFAIFQNPAVM